MKKNSWEFLELYDANWSDMISTCAHHTQGVKSLEIMTKFNGLPQNNPTELGDVCLEVIDTHFHLD